MFSKNIKEAIDNLTSVIEKEIPNDSNNMTTFIEDLDNRFPGSPKAIREIFEKVYEQKFNAKFIW